MPAVTVISTFSLDDNVVEVSVEVGDLSNLLINGFLVFGSGANDACEVS